MDIFLNRFQNAKKGEGKDWRLPVVYVARDLNDPLVYSIVRGWEEDYISRINGKRGQTSVLAFTKRGLIRYLLSCRHKTTESYREELLQAIYVMADSYI